ncbi:PTS sugar transporter subunit IIA [Camelliibacillus cellulosilyticus]|uniref:PTS sugar transporter subunit IIA n=1 Tax=Camelliibacillus cellulosilyticus TaxID=2174486 RepID=A0ABV9GQC1_9BACL
MLDKETESQLIFHDDLIDIGMTATDQEDALAQLSQKFIQKGYVKTTYPEALIKREKTFPTGLALNGIGIAIPHTDAEHVNSASLGIATLRKPVLFRAMDTGDLLEVHILFMLAITHPTAQLKVLQKVVELMRSEEALLSLKHSETKSDVKTIVKPFFGDLLA